MGLITEPESTEVASEALQSVRLADTDFERAEVLKMIAPKLPETLIAEALEIAQGLRDVESRGAALAAIIPHLPSAEGSAILEKALADAQSADFPAERASAMAALAPLLPVPEDARVRGAALEIAQTLGAQGTFVLGKLVPDLKPGERVIAICQLVESCGCMGRFRWH